MREQADHPVRETTADALPEELRERPAFVFGAGHVAGVFCRALQSRGLMSGIAGFVTSAGDGNRRFFDRPVRPLREYARMQETGSAPGTLLLAVHESALEEVAPMLRARGISGIWIAPILPELLYGKPRKLCGEIPVRSILAAQDPERFWIAVRLAAVRAYREKSPERAAVYEKAMSLFASLATAKRRLRHFYRVAEDIMENGFDPGRPILLDEDFRLIDGLHRLALAVSLGKETVSCRVFGRSELYDQVTGEKVFLDRRVLDEADFTAEEKRMLEEDQAILFGQFRGREK